MTTLETPTWIVQDDLIEIKLKAIRTINKYMSFSAKS